MFVIFLCLNCLAHLFIKICLCRLHTIETKKRKFDIVGLFPVGVHNINPEALVWVEAFRYYIEQSNNNCSIFSYRIYDLGQQENHKLIATIAIDALLDESNFHNKLNVNCTCHRFRYLKQAIIGPSTSAKAKFLSTILSNADDISIISYFATSDELGNTDQYPNFLRTIPPDSKQVQVLEELLKKLNWVYVSLVYENSTYGESGYESIKRKKICLSAAIRMETLHHTINLLKHNVEKSNVIVLYGLSKMVKDVLMKAHQEQILNKIWVLCHISGRDSWFLGFNKKFKGRLLFVYPTTIVDADFRNHFFHFDYSSSKHNPWIRNYFESKGINNAKDRTKLACFSKDFDFSYVGFVKNAVLAYTNYVLRSISKLAIEKMCSSNISEIVGFPMAGIRSLNSSHNGLNLNEGNDQFIFNIEVIQEHTQRILNFESNLVGIFSDNNQSIIVVNQNIFRELSNIKSICSEKCSPGYFPRQIGNSWCCWHCSPCSQNSIKPEEGNVSCTECPMHTKANENRTSCLPILSVHIHYNDLTGALILSISVAGVVLNIFTIAVFILKRQTPIVRSSNFNFSMVQLACHLMVFILVNLFIEDQYLLKCRVRIYGIWLSYTIIISVILTKVSRLVLIFQTNHIITKEDILKEKTKEFFIFFFCLIFYACIAITLSLFDAITREDIIEEIETKGRYEKYTKCKSSAQGIVSIAYILILQLICGIQSFRGRKIPGKYNEANCISYAMFLSTFSLFLSVLLTESIRSNEVSLILEAFMIMLANFSILFFLYFYKVWLIIFKSEKNDIVVYREECFQSFKEEVSVVSPKKQDRFVTS